MFTTRIYYQDTDAGGVVYFGNYLKFLEKAWFEYFMSIGISLPEWQDKDTYIMVKEVFLDLMDKVRYAEVIGISTSVEAVKNSSLTLNFTIMRDEQPVTKAKTTMVCVDGRGKLKRMPSSFRDKIVDAAGRV